jgi:hypothetical protein
VEALSTTDSIGGDSVEAGFAVLPREASPGLPGNIHASLEDFADLAGFAVELLDIGEEKSAVEVLALSCAALRESIEAIRERLGTPLLPGEISPLEELARSLGAEGLYRIAVSAALLAFGDPAGRDILESFLEAVGLPGASQLADPDLAASVFAYLALSLGAALSRPPLA